MTRDPTELAVAVVLMALAIMAGVVARRDRAFLPAAVQLAALACLDVARLWTLPLAREGAFLGLWGWRRADVAVFLAWPVVQALTAWWALAVPRRSLAWLGVAFAGYVVAVVALRPALPQPVYVASLAAPRWVASALVFAAWAIRGRLRLTLPEGAAVLLPLGLAAHLFGAWLAGDPWQDWYLATVVSAVVYATEAGILLYALVRQRRAV